MIQYTINKILNFFIVKAKSNSAQSFIVKEKNKKGTKLVRIFIEIFFLFIILISRRKMISWLIIK